MRDSANSLAVSYRGMRPEPIPWWSDCLFGAREFASYIRRFPNRHAARHSASALSFAAGAEPRLHYGRIDNIPGDRLPIGGQIKLLHLERRYPSQGNRANLIYLVSSALPAGAEEIVARGRQLGMRLVWNQNGVAYPGCYGSFYPWFNRRMARLYAQADYIVFQSEFSRISAERYLGPAHVPWSIRFNPVNTSIFLPAEDPIPVQPWQILAAGTSHAFYRTQASLDTLRVLLDRKRAAQLTIAGEFRWSGAERQVLHHIETLKLGPHVKILPPFRQSEAPGIYRQAHVLLHPKYNDPCPTVPLEAMASGLPVVGSKSGGMPELVPDDCGVLVKVPQGWGKDLAPDPSEMADAIEQVMAQREMFSVAARSHAVKTFSLDAWLEWHDNLFHQLLQ